MGARMIFMARMIADWRAPAMLGAFSATNCRTMFTTRIHPRFSDTDALGHINNTVIPVWFLEAREPVLRLFSPQLSLREAALAVVRIEVDYLAETRFGEDVEVRTRVARLGNSSLQLAQEVWQGERVTARGLATLVN